MIKLIGDKKSNNFALLFIISFLTFIGFYCVLLIGVSLELKSITESISMPLRFLILFACIILFFKGLKKFRLKREFMIYLLFIVLYILRVLYDYSLSRPLYIKYTTLLLYLVSFSFVPFFVLTNIRLYKDDFEAIFKGFFVSTLSFSVLALVFYGKHLGTVTRLASAYVEDEVLSPLILSYCSALGIGVLIMYLIHNRVTLSMKILIVGLIILNLVPFYLGASRGSIIALLCPFLFLISIKMNAKILFKSIIYFFITIMLMYYIDIYLGSGLFERFLSIADDVESQSTSASRIGIWSYSLDQFFEYPIFGDKIKTNFIDRYPHNIIIEILQSIGLIGFIPFLILLYRAFLISKNIFLIYSEFSWIPTIFIQAFAQNMFSGAIYTASWFWTSMAILFAFNYYIKYEKRYS